MEGGEPEAELQGANLRDGMGWNGREGTAGPTQSVSQSVSRWNGMEWEGRDGPSPSVSQSIDQEGQG